LIRRGHRKISTTGISAEVGPFEFRRVALLVEVIPCRAASVAQLLTGVTLASDSSIFYHLHRRFFRDATQSSEYPNDFANWADAGLGDSVLAERLANLNLVRTRDLVTVRREISVILAERLQQAGDTKTVRSGLEFIFCQPLMVEFGSGCQARTPREFVDCLRRLPPDAIGYHLFAPFTGGDGHGFAHWFRREGHERLARQLETFDPYLNTLEENQHYLIELIESGLAASDGGASS
jgi:hypothetical protein